jgi:hypothetical protein
MIMNFLILDRWEFAQLSILRFLPHLTRKANDFLDGSFIDRNCAYISRPSTLSRLRDTEHGPSLGACVSTADRVKLSAATYAASNHARGAGCERRFVLVR